MNIDDVLGAKAQAGPELTEKNEISDTTWEIVMPKTRIHTLEQLVEFCKVDLSVWEVERFIANKWEVVMKPPAVSEVFKDKRGRKKVKWTREDGTPITRPLFQIKAFFRKKLHVVSARKEIEALIKQAKLELPTPITVKKLVAAKGGMLELNLTDHHFGKLAWGLETGWANYDVKISTRVFHSALDALLDRSPFQAYEEIWFVIGNDLFNSDDTQSRTTRGTPVESDMRHEKTYVTVRTLMVQAIEKLRYLAEKVKVIVVPGNHDHNATWHLGDSLELYFSKHDDVEIDNRPSVRKYHRFGSTLIGYTHGDKERKQQDLPLLMTVEARDVYGATKFHEWHTGHTHQTRTTEYHGIRVRILPALCPPDAWHAEMGFVGNLRSSEGFVWDKKEGLVAIVIYTDDDARIEKASETPSVVKDAAV